MRALIHVYVYECMHVRTNTCASAGTRERRARLHLLRDLFRRDIRLQVANNGVERVRCDEGNDQAAAFRDEAEPHGDAEEGELRAGELLVPPGSQLAFGREGRVTVGGARGQLGQRGGAAVSVSSPPNAWGTPAPATRMHHGATDAAGGRAAPGSAFQVAVREAPPSPLRRPSCPPHPDPPPPGRAPPCPSDPGTNLRQRVLCMLSFVFSVHELLLTRASRRMADRIKYGSLEAQAGERVPAIA